MRKRAENDMNKSESKYYNTACLMDEALIALLEKKDFEYITVKEICNKAGVNRSTFYLHYETMTDLLEECSQYVLKNFYLQMQNADDFNMADGKGGIEKFIREAQLDELNLVTPKYLEPYLLFIRNNKRLFYTTLHRYKLFGWDNTYEYLYKYLFSPILDRYSMPENVKSYLICFYIKGLIAIVEQWLMNDCAESIPELIEIIMTCMNRQHK